MKKINCFQCLFLVNLVCFSMVSMAQNQQIDNKSMFDIAQNNSLQNNQLNIVQSSGNSINNYKNHVENNDLQEIDSYGNTIENDANSVQTLMRLETMQAISSYKNNQNQLSLGLSHNQNNQSNLSQLNNNLMDDGITQVGVPYLKSIYGVGNKLKAKVNYKQQDYVYKKGQQHPIGIKKNINNILLMTDFSGLCITLVGANNTYDLCLNNY